MSVTDLLTGTNAGGGGSPTAVGGTATTTSHARAEFRRQAESVRRSDFKTIEYKIRKGRKHVNLLQMDGVKVVSGAGGGFRPRRITG